MENCVAYNYIAFERYASDHLLQYGSHYLGNVREYTTRHYHLTALTDCNETLSLLPSTQWKINFLSRYIRTGLFM